MRLALVADDLDDLARKLPVARALRTDRELGVFAGEAAPSKEPGREPSRGPSREPGREPGREATGRVAFLFPGQGSQRPGMLADLFVAFPRLQRHLRGDAAPYAAALFPPAAFRPDRKAAQRERITDTRVAQPVMGIAGTAVHELLEWLGVRADMAGGHSYGELVALSAAGTIRAADLLSVGEARAAAILGAAGEDPGTMAAVGADAAAVREILAAAAVEGVVVANHNGRQGRAPLVSKAQLNGLASLPFAGASTARPGLSKVALGVVLAVILTCPVWLAPAPVTFKDFGVTEITNLLTIFFFIALLAERALEVFIGTWRSPGASQLELVVRNSKENLAPMVVTGNPGS